VVIPACDVAYCLPAVLNALEDQQHRFEFEVIVVDDGEQRRHRHHRRHPSIVTHAVRLPQRMGAATARNLGTALAQGQTVLYLDADMVLAPHVITDIAARASDTTVLVGFRHNLPYDLHQGGTASSSTPEPRRGPPGYLATSGR